MEPTEPKTLDDLEASDPARAELYRDAIGTLSSFVEDAMKRGADPFGTEYFAEMRRIEAEMGVPKECWEFMDLDNLLMSNWLG